jgi:hypothetical protein
MAVRATLGREIMKLQTVLAGVLVAGFALPAAAQTTYYVVQDTKTKHCTIVDKKPVASESTIVGPDGVVYKTRTEAEGAMKTVKVCTND